MQHPRALAPAQGGADERRLPTAVATLVVGGRGLDGRAELAGAVESGLRSGVEEHAALSRRPGHDERDERGLRLTEEQSLAVGGPSSDHPEVVRGAIDQFPVTHRPVTARALDAL